MVVAPERRAAAAASGFTTREIVTIASLVEAETGLAAGHVIRNKGHLKLLALYALIARPSILDAVESVLGPDIACWGSSLFVKPPGDPGFVAWHQDITYWGLDSDKVVTAWLALSPSTVESGCMRVIPGTQTREVVANHDALGQ